MLQWKPGVLSWASGDVSHKSMAASAAIIEMQSRKREFINSFSMCPLCVHTVLDIRETVVSKRTWSLGAYILMREINRSQINTIIIKWIMGINRVEEGYSEEVTFKQVEG